MFILQIVTLHPEWCTSLPHPYRHFPGFATTDLAWAVATTLHLVLLTHFMTLKSIPDPEHRPRGAVGADERLTVRAWGCYITSTL